MDIIPPFCNSDYNSQTITDIDEDNAMDIDEAEADGFSHKQVEGAEFYFTPMDVCIWRRQAATSAGEREIRMNVQEKKTM